MARSADVTAALATLQARWGAAAPTIGALAVVPAIEPDRGSVPELGDRVIPSGFQALDSILGIGGLPKAATVALRGDHSSGKTTLALRVAAEAQAGGAIVAWLDLARAFDPVEAVARGVRPEWLVVLTPVDLEESLALAGALLSARTVDILLVDLPDGRDPAVKGVRVGDRLGRLAALARRAGTLLLVLEPPTLGERLAGAIGDASGLRLELTRRSWIRLGRDVVGQRTEVAIARNRFGPLGRRAELRILYADGGARDACLAEEALLVDDGPRGLPAAPPGSRIPVPFPFSSVEKGPLPSTDPDATPSPPLAPPAAPPRPATARSRPHLRVLGDPDRPRRTALDGRDGRRRGPDRALARRATRDRARDRAPARTRGDLPRPRT